MGPAADSKRDTNWYIPRPSPLSSGRQQSPSIPGPIAYARLPPGPESNLALMRRPLLFAPPQTAVQTRNQRLQTCMIYDRPYNSDRGLRTRGPNAMARRYIDDTICVCVEAIEMSCAICGSAGAMIEELMIVISPMKDTVRWLTICDFLTSFGDFQSPRIHPIRPWQECYLLLLTLCKPFDFIENLPGWER